MSGPVQEVTRTGGADRPALAHAGPRVEYRPDVDGLRALAVLLVIGFHALPSRFPGGFVGVDVFLVISGYLITGNIVRDLQAGRFTFLEFYARRFRRIVPALVVVVVSTGALAWWSLLANEFAALSRHIMGAATFTTNILLWNEAGYFDPAAELKPFLHLWSLGIEEQFYLVWPATLFLIFQRTRGAGPAIGALAVSSFILNVMVMRHHPTAAFYLLPTRFWELLLGAGLAYAQRSRPASPAPTDTRFLDRVRGSFAVLLSEPGNARSTNVRAAVGLGLILAVTYSIDRRAPFPGWWAVLPTIGTLLFISAGSRAWPNRAIFSARPAVLLGLISYPLYLWHWPLLSLARIVEGGEPPGSIRALAVGAAVVLSVLTWRLVEAPIKQRVFRLADFPSMRSCVLASLCSLVVVTGAGWIGWEGEGFPSRFTSSALDLSPPRFDAVYPACSGPLSPGRALSWCRTSRLGEPETALFGDSHAYYMFPGLAKALSANLLVIGETACAPLLDVRSFREGQPEQCQQSNGLSVDLLIGSPAIKTVVLLSLGPYYFSGTSIAAEQFGEFDASRWRLEPVNGMPRLAKPEIFEEGLSRTIARLQMAGKRVVFYIDVPELSFFPVSCIDARPLRLPKGVSRARCAMPRSAVIDRQAAYRRIVTDLSQRHPGLRVFDPLPFLCDTDWCHASREGKLLYRDTHHVSQYGGEYLGRHFDTWLQSGP